VPKSLVFSALPVFIITSIAWIYGVSRHTFLVREIPQYIGIFLVPGATVCVCSWLLFQKRTWGRVLGGLLLIPSLGLWFLSLLLVSIGFKIH